VYRFRFLLVSALVYSAACLPSRAQRVTGTYAVWLCKNACAARDTAGADVAGYLVLSGTPLRLRQDAFAAKIIDASMFFYRGDQKPNACFRLDARKGSRLMAGIIPAAITNWSTHGDTVQVQLYASPDASYNLRALVKDGHLLGLGEESGFIGGSFDHITGPAHGVRLGPADATRCTSGPA
jgi:hypothetical protein